MTFEQFTATRRHVSDVSRAVAPLGFDFGDDPGTPGFLYDDGSLVIYGTPASPTCRVVWLHDFFEGTLAECEVWLYQCLVDEGLAD